MAQDWSFPPAGFSSESLGTWWPPSGTAHAHDSALARPRHGITTLPSRHGRPEDPSAASPELRFRGHRRRATGPALRGGGKLRLFPPEHTGAGRQLQVHARARPVVELTPARAVRSRAATSATAPAAASQARPRRRRLRPRPPPIRPSCLRPPPLRRGLSCASRAV